MNLLLDTHTVLWWLNDDPSLSDSARSAISDPGNTVFLVSGVSVIVPPEPTTNPSSEP